MQEIWQSILVAAQQMTWVEIVATFFGILQVILSSKISVWTYPAGIVAVILAFYFLWTIGLYAEAWLQVFYFVMSIYGWYKWVALKKENKNATLDSTSAEISICSSREHIIYIVMTLMMWMGIYFVLSEHTDSTVPLADSFTTALFFVGMILMALKKIENWIYLIVGNVLCIPLLWYKESYLFSLQFLVFTLIAIWGYLEWRKKLAVK